MKTDDDNKLRQLEEEKLTLKISKLKQDLKRGRKPWFIQAGFITIVIGIIITGGVNWLINGKGIEANLTLKEIKLEKQESDYVDRMEKFLQNKKNLTAQEFSLKMRESALKESHHKVDKLQNDINIKEKNLLERYENFNGHSEKLRKLTNTVGFFNSYNIMSNSLKIFCDKLISKLDSLENGYDIHHVTLSGANKLKNGYLDDLEKLLDKLKILDEINFESETSKIVEVRTDNHYFLNSINSVKKLTDLNLYHINQFEKEEKITSDWNNKLLTYRNNIKEIRNSLAIIQSELNSYLMVLNPEIDYTLNQIKAIIQ